MSKTNRVRGRRWTNLRNSFLHANPLCVFCKYNGRVEAATDVDHKVPIKDAPGRMFDLQNLQALCHRCHVLKGAWDRKTRKERARIAFWADD